MIPNSLAIYWHQHQPYYPDDVSGETLMPWVRLHAIKDYYGMALHLLEVPEFHCTINLVPSLLKQLDRYSQGQSDRHLDVSLMPADGLSGRDAEYLLDQFFMANFETMIGRYPRYRELYEKRGFGIDTAAQAITRFTERDIRDLQVWNNLTWFHEFCFELDQDLFALREKGRGFTEKEKQWILEKQIQVVRQIIPLHRQLAERGQVELTTTPFYHPIMPLLWDKRLARQAMGGCELPKFLDPYRGDLKIHLERAVEAHEQWFGTKPQGMWPSEGSVSQDIIPNLAQAGIEWIATDEEILSHSTNGWVSRDSQGHLRHPEMLYRPWRIEEQGHSMQIIFRDHGLSDLIGFHYQRFDPERAVDDLLGRVEAIGRAVESNMGGKPALVPIILDGENCWEYFHDGGVRFLRTLYRNAVLNKRIRPVRMRDHLQEYPATDRVGHLFAGSWINHNFAIWIGHSEDNQAWDLLHQTREFVLDARSRGVYSESELDRAWEEILIAEGSDWFWWYGDDHSSLQDGLFDQLFRKHLQNAYTILGVPAPSQLNRPIAHHAPRVTYTQPKGFLSIKVDGRRTYFEWLNAGHYVAGNERGTMTLVSQGLFREVFFGFDDGKFALRLDTATFARNDLKLIEEIRVNFVEPAGYVLRLFDPVGRSVTPELLVHQDVRPIPGFRWETDLILEMLCPLDLLGLSEDSPVQFFLEAWGGRQSLDRAPREGIIGLKVPSDDYEQIMWQA